MRKEWFEILEDHFRTKTATAKNLGITLTHYLRVRNGKHYGSGTLRRLIKMTVQQIAEKDCVRH